MTLYLNMRQGAVGGALIEPYVLSGDGLAAKPTLRTLDHRAAAERVQGRTVVFAVHGFNVSYEKGVRSLAKLEKALALPSDHVFMGVLWPGDYWIPAINYPAEWQDAVQGGQHLARYADAVLKDAQGFSFFSHSLGGRLALEAASHLRRRLVRVCLAAPATDDDCLERPYDVAVRNAERLTWLASKKDNVLRIAYRLGDWAGDLFFGDDDAPGSGALGWHGARWRGSPTAFGVQIPKEQKFDHGDYFPPSDMAGVIKPTQAKAIAYARTFLLGGSPSWA